MQCRDTEWGEAGELSSRRSDTGTDPDGIKVTPQKDKGKA